MARRWLVLTVGMVGAGSAAGQAVAQPPPAGAAAPPSMVAPLGPPKRVEWPREVAGKAISYYIERLDNSDPSVRQQAVTTLPLFGPQAARVASRKLVGLMDDRDPGVRVNAILALATIGFDSKDDLHRGIAGLQKSIGSTVDGSVVRLYAAKCLGLIGPEASAAIPDLIRLTRDASWETRDAAAAALGRVGLPVWDNLTPQPAGAIPQPKRAASGPARSRLTEMLKDPSQAVRLEAIHSLLLIGPPTPKDPDQYIKEAQPVIDEVTRRLGPGTDKAPGEKDPQVRLWLHALTFSYDDRHAATAVKEMKDAVTSADPAMRFQGLTALTVCWPLAPQATDEVRLALKAAEPDVAKAAIMCVRRLPPADGRKFVGDLQAVAGSAADADLKQMATEAAKMLAPGAVPGK